MTTYSHAAAAKRELGHALKTEFVLQYMSEPQPRTKVRRGLLKGEQLHALERDVYYGQHLTEYPTCGNN